MLLHLYIKKGVFKEIKMKKILALAAVVALTAGVSGYAANMKDNVKFSGEVGGKFTRISCINDNDHKHVNVDHYYSHVRIQADADISDKVSVSGRFTHSKIYGDLTEDVIKGMIESRIDRLHVMYKPVEGMKVDLGRTGVQLGTDGIFYDNSFDGVVASYDKGKFAVEGGIGKIRSLEVFDIGFKFPEIKNVKYIKGSAAINDNVNVGGFVAGATVSDTDYDFYGINAKADITDKVSVFGDYIKSDKPNDCAFKDIGVVYGKATEEVGTWQAGLTYYDVDKGMFMLFGKHPFATHLVWASFAGGSFWTAQAKATVMKDVSVGTFLNLNGHIADKDAMNSWGFELNYAF